MPSQFGRYELLERISLGGMAEVFRAQGTGAAGFQKTVAIKRILPQFSDDARFVSMFIEEARILATLSHANIGQVYDFGQIDGHYFIAMEHLPGQDLASLQVHLSSRGQRVPLPIVIRIGIDLASALHYAHSKRDAAGKPLGIIHRDVSPPNVFITYDGCVKLIDFGIAKVKSRDHDTAAGLLKGKYGYLSPEQAEGRKDLDGRSDLFSLGTVLFELVTGQRLFDAETEMGLVMQVRRAEIPSIVSLNSTAPAGLERIIRRLLARDPDERFQNAEVLHEALSSLSTIAGVGCSGMQLRKWMTETVKPALEPRPLRAPVLVLQPEPALETNVSRSDADPETRDTDRRVAPGQSAADKAPGPYGVHDEGDCQPTDTVGPGQWSASPPTVAGGLSWESAEDDPATDPDVDLPTNPVDLKTAPNGDGTAPGEAAGTSTTAVGGARREQTSAPAELDQTLPWDGTLPASSPAPAGERRQPTPTPTLTPTPTSNPRHSDLDATCRDLPSAREVPPGRDARAAPAGPARPAAAAFFDDEPTRLDVDSTRALCEMSSRDADRLMGFEPNHPSDTVLGLPACSEADLPRPAVPAEPEPHEEVVLPPPVNPDAWKIALSSEIATDDLPSYLTPQRPARTGRWILVVLLVIAVLAVSLAVGVVVVRRSGWGPAWLRRIVGAHVVQPPWPALMAAAAPRAADPATRRPGVARSRSRVCRD